MNRTRSFQDERTKEGGRGGSEERGRKRERGERQTEVENVRGDRGDGGRGKGRQKWKM